MARTPESTMKKAIICLVVLCALIVTPRSLAEDLLSPLVETVGAPETSPALPPSQPEPPSPSPAPEAPAIVEKVPAPPPLLTASPKPVSLQKSESQTATSSPTPLPPHATTVQAMRIAVPAIVSTDPRARSVFLPRLQASGAETLLVCGFTNAASVNFSASLPGVESVGSGSPMFRLSGPTNLVMATLNGEMGARVTSTSKALPGSIVSLSFISLSESSLNQSLCNNGSPSNTRTISFRALNMDLNMVKDGVRLK